MNELFVVYLLMFVLLLLETDTSKTFQQISVKFSGKFAVCCRGLSYVFGVDPEIKALQI